MAKFIVNMEHEEVKKVTSSIKVSVTRDEVVEELQLEGEERQDWRERIEEYIDAVGIEWVHDEGEVLSTEDEWDDEKLNEVIHDVGDA